MQPVCLDLHETKRARDDCSVEEPPSKRKRVAFAEFSSMRRFEMQTDLEEICDGNSTADDVTTCCNDDSASSAACEWFADLTSVSVSDTETTTKTQDGPSHATLATNTLIRTVANQKSISRTKVAELLREAEATIPTPLTPLRADLHSTTDAAPFDVSTASAHPAPNHAHLCMAVRDRLRDLSERIEARGKASILPCCTNLNRSFLPALRFLMASSSSCVSLEARRVSMAQG